MEIDTDKIDDCTLALLYLGVWQHTKGVGCRAWKSFDWDTMDRLHEKGYISDPKTRARSVILDEQSYQKAKRLFEEFFTV